MYDRSEHVALHNYSSNNHINNKILNGDWFSASLFLALLVLGHVGVQLQLSNNKFFFNWTLMLCMLQSGALK